MHFIMQKIHLDTKSTTTTTKTLQLPNNECQNEKNLLNDKERQKIFDMLPTANTLRWIISFFFRNSQNRKVNIRMEMECCCRLMQNWEKKIEEFVHPLDYEAEKKNSTKSSSLSGIRMLVCECVSVYLISLSSFAVHVLSYWNQIKSGFWTTTDVKKKPQIFSNEPRKK